MSGRDRQALQAVGGAAAVRAIDAGVGMGDAELQDRREVRRRRRLIIVPHHRPPDWAPP
ncbi:hypothetical protein QFZ27_001716 [Inquilinus ginsengisoli]|uniref:hypothetical protein n=1 Tax=Inquilinus ginsengisoli TaxID=363840 RepID=UPI003D1C1892